MLLIFWQFYCLNCTLIRCLKASTWPGLCISKCFHLYKNNWKFRRAIWEFVYFLYPKSDILGKRSYLFNLFRFFCNNKAKLGQRWIEHREYSRSSKVGLKTSTRSSCILKFRIICCILAWLEVSFFRSENFSFNSLVT
jgi:hypothetical protein